MRVGRLGRRLPWVLSAGRMDWRASLRPPQKTVGVDWLGPQLPPRLRGRPCCVAAGGKDPARGRARTSPRHHE